jgi:Ca2+-transporting ATPase
MTTGALVAYAIGDAEGDAVLASTMLLTTLSLFHLAAGLLSRDQHATIFDRAAIPGSAQLRRYGIALLAIVAVTGLEFLNRIVGTTELSFGLWSAAVGLALTLVVVEELRKLVVRSRERRRTAAPAPVPATA